MKVPAWMPLAALAGLALIAGHRYLWRSPVAVPDFASPIHLEEARALVDRTPVTRLPYRIEYDSVALYRPSVASRYADARLCVARPTETLAGFRIVYESGRVLLNPSGDLELAGELPWLENLDEEAARSQETLLATTSLVFGLDTLSAHWGGAARSARIYGLTDRLVLTREQLESRSLREAGFPPSFLEAIQIVDLQSVHRLRPGLALLSDSRMPAGTLMAYVRLQSGCELLFLGGCFPNYDQVRCAALPPRLTLLQAGYDASPLALFTRALAELPPEIVLVPVMDQSRLDDLEADALIFRARR